MELNISSRIKYIITNNEISFVLPFLLIMCRKLMRAKKVFLIQTALYPFRIKIDYNNFITF